MDDEYIKAVHAVVTEIPAGRVMTYGLIAEVVSDRLVAAGSSPRGGSRQVGRIMSESGGNLPWWRVVNASGDLPPHLQAEALAELRAEGTALTVDGSRVALRRAVWFPEEDWGQAGERLV